MSESNTYYVLVMETGAWYHRDRIVVEWWAEKYGYLTSRIFNEHAKDVKEIADRIRSRRVADISSVVQITEMELDFTCLRKGQTVFGTMLRGDQPHRIPIKAKVIAVSPGTAKLEVPGQVPISLAVLRISDQLGPVLVFGDHESGSTDRFEFVGAV